MVVEAYVLSAENKQTEQQSYIIKYLEAYEEGTNSSKSTENGLGYLIQHIHCGACIASLSLMTVKCYFSC